MEPEVVMNCWIFIQSISPMHIIYELGVRPYMMAGSDDEKTRLLKDLAISDFHFARRFPVPDRYSVTLDESELGGARRTRKGLTAVNPMISGTAQLEYFQEALDAVQASFPTRRLGKDGATTKMPPVNRKNLLSVVTNVNVDSRGNQIPRTDDSRRNTVHGTIANLWAFYDERARTIYAVSGRPYMVHGSDTERRRILKALAPYDFPMAATVLVTQAPSSGSKYPKGIFSDVLNGIPREIPTAIGIDGKIRNPITVSSDELTLNATLITERSSNIGDAVPIQLVDAPNPTTAQPKKSAMSFWRKLVGGGPKPTPAAPTKSQPPAAPPVSQPSKTDQACETDSLAGTTWKSEYRVEYYFLPGGAFRRVWSFTNGTKRYTEEGTWKENGDSWEARDTDYVYRGKKSDRQMSVKGWGLKRGDYVNEWIWTKQ
jgi:hypothetical protein